jgi:phosphinothricin acetyltransferase
MPSEQTSIIIRETRDGDLPAITAIYNDAVVNTTATYEIDPPSQSTMSDRLAAIKDAGLPCLVAEGSSDSPNILGYAYVNAFRPRPAYRFTVEHSVYVASDARARGVGSLLMRNLIQECERLGFRQIVAVIGDGRPDSPSVLFHRKLGFRHSGKLEGSGYKFGRWLDTSFMQLPINGGIATHPDSSPQPGLRLQGQ